MAVRSQKSASQVKPVSRPAKAPPASRAVAKALRIVELLHGAGTPLPLGVIASEVGLAKPSAYRLLRTLEGEGYLTADPAGNYSMPARVRPAIASRMLSRFLNAALPCMNDLLLKYRETVSLAALFENHAEVIAVRESPEMIRMGNIVGRILPPNSSSLGKAILAYQTEERREKLIRSFGVYRFTDCSITDSVELRKELERVRQCGYATDMEESVPHGCCYGVPVLAESGCAIGAISSSMPKQRHTTERGKQIVESLRAAARQIEKAMREETD